MALLVGSDVNTSGGGGNANQELYGQFTAAASGTATEIQVYISTSCNVKVGIYTDSGGSPDTRIGVNNTGTSCATGWNTISIGDTSISSGTTYWLGIISDTGSFLGVESFTGGTSGYINGSYSGGMPTTAGTPTGLSWILSIGAYGASSYESDLGTGSLGLGSNGISASVSRDQADLDTGNLSLSGGNVEATLTVAADADLGTGALSILGGSVTADAGYVSSLSTGTLLLGAGSPRIAEDFEAELGTGAMVLGATRIKEPEDVSAGNLLLTGSPIVTADAGFIDYNQGRTFALPAERMRVCVWAENFSSAYKTRQIGGTVAGSPSYTSSVVLDGLSFITYNQQPITNTLSAVVRFSASAVSSGLLFGTVDPVTSSVDGWRIWVDSTGIRANHSDGTNIGTQCGIDYAYADGEIHTVTYVIDMVSGDHVLYVDTEDDSQATTASGTIGTGRQLAIGGIGFVGTVERARLFESDLTAQEHVVYYNDSLASIISDSIATYRCDTVCDQTDHIWTKTLNLYDLTKGDGVSAGYPTHNTQGHYEFDGVDDYVSDWPEQPTLHTDSIAKTTSYPDGVPVIQQVNDDTIKTLLTTSGSYTGNMHSLVLCNGELTELEKTHLEYRQLHRLTRETYVDPFHHSLMIDGANILHMDFRSPDNYLYDYSDTRASTSANGTTWDDGLTFGLSTSKVTVSDEADLRLNKLTINVTGFGIDDISGSDYLVVKDGNYALYVSSVDASNFSATFNGSSLTMSRGDINHIAVTAVDGAKPRFYSNGEYRGEGSTTVTLNDATTNDLVIGNISTGSFNFSGTIKTVNVYNTPLTDLEIRRAYNNELTDKNFPGKYLIMGDSTLGTVNVLGDRHFLSMFTASRTGYVDMMHVYCPTTSGNVKVNVYDDTGATYPGNLLGCTDTSTPVLVGQWNDVALATPAPVTAGNVYWMGLVTEINNTGLFSSNTDPAASVFSPITYSTFTAPDPLPVGYSVYTRYLNIEGYDIS